MPVPKPPGFAKSVISFGLIFSGIPAGLLFYNSIAEKLSITLVPKILIGFITFPIYTLAGIIGSIPFIIYSGIFFI